MVFDIERYAGLVMETGEVFGSHAAVKTLKGFIPEVRDEILQRFMKEYLDLKSKT